MSLTGLAWRSLARPAAAVAVERARRGPRSRGPVCRAGHQRRNRILGQQHGPGPGRAGRPACGRLWRAGLDARDRPGHQGHPRCRGDRPGPPATDLSRTGDRRRSGTAPAGNGAGDRSGRRAPAPRPPPRVGIAAAGADRAERAHLRAARQRRRSHGRRADHDAGDGRPGHLPGDRDPGRRRPAQRGVRADRGRSAPDGAGSVRRRWRDPGGHRRRLGHGRRDGFGCTGLPARDPAVCPVDATGHRGIAAQLDG